MVIGERKGGAKAVRQRLGLALALAITAAGGLAAAGNGIPGDSQPRRAAASRQVCDIGPPSPKSRQAAQSHGKCYVEVMTRTTKRSVRPGPQAKSFGAQADPGCVWYYQGAEAGPGYVVVKVHDGGEFNVLVVDAAAQWCWNGSNSITNIWDTSVRSWNSGSGICQNLGNFHWRHDGGIGYSWYQTHIVADWHCDYPGHGTHYHSLEWHWAHNASGHSAITDVAIYTWS
jgi:hypothetical protein